MGKTGPHSENNEARFQVSSSDRTGLETVEK